MSGSRRTNQGPRYEWGGSSEAQHAQYVNQGGVDHITAGLSGVSLNPPYVHEGGFENTSYPPDGQYYPSGSYYPQADSYPPQEGSYAQTSAYPTEPQYTHAAQYSGDNYNFQAADNSVDQNSQYTTDPRHQYSTHHKGKSRVVDQGTNNKPKGSGGKGRDRDKDPGKGKSSAPKPGRPKPGKGQLEEEVLVEDDGTPFPFYGKPYARSEQKAPGLDSSHQDETVVEKATYDNSYPAASQPSGEQTFAYGDHSASVEDPSGYNYPEPYASNDYQAGGSSSSRQPRREESQPSYMAAMAADPYPPEIPDDIASAIAESDGFSAGGGSHLSGDDSGISMSGDYPYPVYEEGVGIQTPRAMTPQATIAPTPGQGAQLDERFIVEPSSRFVSGEVFKILWSEPLGAGRGDLTDAESRSHMGQRFYVGIRRFIIVRTDEGHSTCVPILTYERRACTKKGVKPRTHGIIYPEGAKPRTIPGEPQLGSRPVKIELDYPSERIVKESRVNYSKLVTVEHNVRVFFIGRISPEDMQTVNQSVDNCWEYKNKLSRSSGDHRRHQSYRTHR